MRPSFCLPTFGLLIFFYIQLHPVVLSLHFLFCVLYHLHRSVLLLIMFISINPHSLLVWFQVCCLLVCLVLFLILDRLHPLCLFSHFKNFLFPHDFKLFSLHAYFEDWEPKLGFRDVILTLHF